MTAWAELRQWAQFMFVAIGGVVALVAYFQNLKQRRVENALKFIQLFRDGLKEDDMDHWKTLLWATSEPAGAKHGEYIEQSTNLGRPLGDYFSEGAPDGHAIARMAESLNVVCHQVVEGAADASIVYYELGQLIETMNGWLRSIPGHIDTALLSDSYSSIDAFVEKYPPHQKAWPRRVHAYVE